MSGEPPQLRDQVGVRTGLRIGGAIIAVIGLILTIAGFVSFFRAFGSTSASPPEHFWLLFIGIPLLGIGLMMLIAGFLGATTRYVAGEVAPTAKDALGYVGVGPRQAICPFCGQPNPAGSGICVRCGKPVPAA
jgi:hypothetical protein